MIIPLKCSGKYEPYVLEGTVKETLKSQWGKLAEQNVIVSLTFLSRIPTEQNGNSRSKQIWRLCVDREQIKDDRFGVSVLDREHIKDSRYRLPELQ
ncbi:Zinc finger protein [Gossypium arboreum]|uniref:Zinc finger protein n=1 Tax=Gossypium arboreum TaxID=29729 RepID=A0A0B0MFV1_GOSAR|nr:Zinc finger protein [Gossypium arboreum]